VRIEGETGTGKEMVARLIHELGPPASRPWVVIDCTALPDALADAELFGAARGAFTGAVTERRGLVAQADGGTLLLDELTELPLAQQAKLLRVLQDGSYRRVGEDRPRQVRVRVVATTNRDVKRELEAGRLKPDLFHRLNGHRITMTPLRRRPHEIAPLAIEFARRFGGLEITPEALVWLGVQDWPGNVRQLQMVIRLAIGAHSGDAPLGRKELEPLLREIETRIPSDAPGTAEGSESLGARRREGERAALRRALDASGGVVRDAARALGISRQAMYKALRRTGISPEREGRSA